MQRDIDDPMKRTLVRACTGAVFWAALAGGCSLTAVTPIIGPSDDAATSDGPAGTSPDGGAPPDALGNDADAGACAPPLVLRYESPGCGTSALPVCGGSVQDACAISVCGCDGTTIVKCDYASQPWDHVGACGGDVDAPADQMTSDADAGACPPPLVLRYESPGCGAASHPVCGSLDQDACAIAVCGCSGVTLVKCDYASEAWEHAGECATDAASSDAKGE